MIDMTKERSRRQEKNRLLNPVRFYFGRLFASMKAPKRMRRTFMRVSTFTVTLCTLELGVNKYVRAVPVRSSDCATNA